jgi:hypothetical protein
MGSSDARCHDFTEMPGCGSLPMQLRDRYTPVDSNAVDALSSTASLLEQLSTAQILKR